MRDMLASTASFINCTNGVNGDNPSEITRPDCDLVIRTLRGNNAYSFLTGAEGENKFGTAPVRDAYFGLGHTDMIGQLDNVTGFVKDGAKLKPLVIDMEARWGDMAQAA